ncbi:aminotransferase class V-fold PLP-dependent enzyme [Nakamurella sp. YIM 132087]|uniref:Aminotransferase class V-fold PLP-dependent enzyme n=1 Tax=Nakamurella alba TaxID=2665158 RepID=A0A7K1FQ76_9ACTN|nr:aminotransferase class V-fold PLP-dependent enzyme [Nakamurella alba]MTD16291.1 aminotransferase class V-fold PLP-dependent enzyme [Nakamurella alba]
MTMTLHTASGIRSQFPCLADLVYLNTGTVGPLPTTVIEAATSALRTDLERGRSSGRRFQGIARNRTRARELCAALVGVEPAAVTLTSGTTEGVMIALRTVGWTSGAELLVSDAEHPAVTAALRGLCERHGIVLRSFPTTGSDEQVLAAVREALGPRTAAVLVSHVLFADGRPLPVAGICAAAAGVGAVSVVDGAQAVGAIQVDVPATGADFYAFPGQKWLLSIEGTGALVSRTAVSGLDPAPVPGAAVAALIAALEFRDGIDSEPELVALAARRNAELRAVLESTPGVRILSPASATTLTSFVVEGTASSEVVAALGAARIGTRVIPENDAIRISAGFWTDTHDIDRFAAGLAGLAGSGRSTDPQPAAACPINPPVAEGPAERQR